MLVNLRSYSVNALASTKLTSIVLTSSKFGQCHAGNMKNLHNINCNDITRKRDSRRHDINSMF